MKRTPFLLTIAVGLLLTLLCACTSREGDHPLLVAADSAIVAADYRAADSLLARFDAEAATAAPDRPVAMRRQLLALTRRYVDDALTDADFSMADSLSRYYRHHGNERQLALSLLAVGDIYKYGGIFPNAVNNLKEALFLAEGLDDQLLAGWAAQGLGDLYFYQLMLDDCIIYYRRFYTAAQSRRDTLRMAYAAFRMGKVCTINNDVDSTFWYYNRTLELTKHLPAGLNDIETSTLSSICDIHIQLGNYDKAFELLTHDSINTINWAYWHAGMNHTDSAIYYFQKGLDTPDWYARVEYLKNLVMLTKEENDQHQTAVYYEMLVDAQDSLHFHSQEAATRNADIQYNFSQVEKERDEAIHRNRVFQILLVGIVTTTIIFFLVLFTMWKNYRRKKEIEVIQMKLLHRESLNSSLIRLEENERQIIDINDKLNNPIHSISKEERRLLNLELEQLMSDNETITKEQQEQVRRESEWKSTELYRTIKKHAGEPDFHLNEEQWQELSTHIDAVYVNFSKRLLGLANLSTYDLRICYLVKMGIEPSKIAIMLYKEMSTISVARRRLYKKLTNSNGSSKSFDELIAKF